MTNRYRTNSGSATPVRTAPTNRRPRTRTFVASPTREARLTRGIRRHPEDI